MAMFGLDCGHVIPLHCPGGDGMVLVLTGGRVCPLPEPERDKLYADAWRFLCDLYRPFKKILGASMKVDALRERVESLNERERKILTLLSHGKQIKRIACTLNVSTKTVNNDIESICTKLNVVTRTQAAVKYAMAGGTSVIRGDEFDALMLMSGL